MEESLSNRFFYVMEQALLNIIDEPETEPEEIEQITEALSFGAQLRQHGLTPVYIIDRLSEDIMVSSHEKMNNKLH